MRTTFILAGVVATLALPATAGATGKPTRTDRSNAAQECRFERGSSAATHEAFTAKYRTFGKCVSGKAREEAAERKAARDSASEACRAERGKKNAFGKCVSAAAKTAKEQADAADRAAATARKRAAKQCATERGKTDASRAAFASKYGTNTNKKNAFGKCVSAAAKA